MRARPVLCFSQGHREFPSVHGLNTDETSSWLFKQHLSDDTDRLRIIILQFAPQVVALAFPAA